MKKRLSRTESQALTRTRLLKSAMRVFVKHGYAGATVDLIADAAGYSKGAVYSNFAGKEAIFLVLLRYKLVADIENLKALAQAEADVDRLLSGVRAYLEAREDVLAFTTIVVEFLTSGELTAEGSKECAALYDQQRNALAGLLEAVFERVAIKSPASPKDLAMTLVAQTLGLAAQRAIDKDAVPVTRWSRLIESYLRTIIGPY